MSPEFHFALILIVKMAITAAFVVAATVTAECAGPLVGGLVATLPIGAGPAYVFLALDHDARFIAQSAVASLAINALNIVFAATYTMLAQKRSLLVSLGTTYIVWILLAWIVNSQHWPLGAALLLNVLALSIGLWLVRPLRHVPMMRLTRRWYDYALRAGLVSILVGVLVTFSFRIGPYFSGLLAVFPVVLTSIILILHNRGGDGQCRARPGRLRHCLYRAALYRRRFRQMAGARRRAGCRGRLQPDHLAGASPRL